MASAATPVVGVHVDLVTNRTVGGRKAATPWSVLPQNNTNNKALRLQAVALVIAPAIENGVDGAGATANAGTSYVTTSTCNASR